MLDAALEYREAGLHPIPISPRGKRPAIPSWKPYQDTMPTVEEITAWWTLMPDANIALIMGRGIFAVDVDGEEGEKALHAAIDGFPMLKGPRSKTARGWHCFFAGQEIPDRIGLLPKVDIRGVGYVVVPPSIHESGHVYTWERPIDGPLPTAHPKLYDMIRSAPVSTASGLGGIDWLTQALVGVGEGGRDSTCTRLAGYLLGRGLSQDATDLILQMWAERCVPPFPPDQVSKCVESIAKREGAPEAPPHSLREALARVLGYKPSQGRNVAATEFNALDEMLDGGFEPGLILMGARPGIGKSALALHISRLNAKHRGVLYISREMTVDALVRRLLAQASGVGVSTLKRGYEDDITKELVTIGAEKLAGLEMWLTSDIASTAQLEEALKVYQPGALGLVVIDYLQMMKAAEPIRESRQRVEAVASELKRLAVLFDLPILALSSLSRPERGAANWRPTLASLRESGELEHAADAVLLLHREEGSDLMEVHLAKQRDGEVGEINLGFHGPTVSFK
jgi:hypothetical protein